MKAIAGSLGIGVGLLLVELALRRAMADQHVVASLLSPGAHTGLGTLVLGVSFLLVRLSLYVAFPAVLGGLVLRVITRAGARGLRG
jgi:hypothetical protein